VGLSDLVRAVLDDAPLDLEDKDRFEVRADRAPRKEAAAAPAEGEVRAGPTAMFALRGQGRPPSR
jgi:hypothetical protein